MCEHAGTRERLVAGFVVIAGTVFETIFSSHADTVGRDLTEVVVGAPA